MLGEIHRLFWFAYYFFSNLLTGNEEEHQTKKRDVACSTLSNAKKGYSGGISINSKKRWRKQASATIPYPWKWVIIKQIRPTIFSKENPRIKFFPMYLWKDPEPDFFKMLMLSIWILGAEAAARGKVHKETQWTNEEVDFEMDQIEEQQNEEIEDKADDKDRKVESEENVVEQNVENIESEIPEPVSDKELNDEETFLDNNEITVIESEDLEESSQEKSINEETASQKDEDLTEHISQENPEDNNEDAITEDMNNGEEQNRSEVVPEITIEESEEVVVENPDDEGKPGEEEVENNNEDQTTEEKLKDEQPKTTTEEKQFESKAVQTNYEEPMSFYFRRVSLTSSRSGENSPRTVLSPSPAPPPPQMVANKQSMDSKDPPESPVKGGVSVFVPGLVDAAKESVQRRLRVQSSSPDTNKRTASETRPAPLVNNVIKTQTNTTPVNNYRTWRNDQVVRKINSRTVDSPNQTQYFIFEPKRQTSKTEPVHNNNVPWTEQHHNYQHRIYTESPTTTANFLLGQSVFNPVNEVERIRDDFNRRSESRAQSYSRSPSVMSQSYHESRDQDNYSVHNHNEPTNVIRQHFPQNMRADSRTWNQKPWTLREDQCSESFFPGSSIGAMTRVLECKVTEKHVEKDEEGQILNGWRQQDWKGTRDHFWDPDCTPLL